MGRIVYSIELLAQMVEEAAAGSPEVAKILRDAIQRGASAHPKRNASGRPANVDRGDLARLSAINTAALFNALTVRDPTPFELRVRRLFAGAVAAHEGIEPLSGEAAARAIATMEEASGQPARSTDTIKREAERGDLESPRGKARFAPE